MPQASYLVAETPHYRLIMRFFYDRQRAHAHFVRSDAVLVAVRQVFADYDDATCRRHLDQMEKWRLIRLIPEQSKPANLLELRQRPQVYQAESAGLRLEALRVSLEAESAAAAALNPAAMEQLVQRLQDLVDWTQHGLGQDTPDGRTGTHTRWHGVHRAFQEFARGVEDYLGDLPRHRPRETLDYERFRAYRDVITRYLSDYIRRLFDRRDLIRDLLGRLGPVADPLGNEVAAVAAAQVRSDATTSDFATELARFRSDFTGLAAYFADGGDVDVLLEQAQDWVTDVTAHARRLSEQHLGSTVREQILLDLARRFAAHTRPEQSEWLAQVAFGAALPLHWRGRAPAPAGPEPWLEPALTVPLQAVRRGSRQQVRPDSTEDRALDQLRRMQSESAGREQLARELLAFFGVDGVLDLARLQVAAPRQRQLLLRLLYRALSQGGRASLGYRDWNLAVVAPAAAELGLIAAPDGELILPRLQLRLQRGR